MKDFNQMTDEQLYALEDELVSLLRKEKAPGREEAYRLTKEKLWALRGYLYSDEPEEHHDRVDRMMGE
jgi:hypothetical protein